MEFIKITKIFMRFIFNILWNNFTLLINKFN